MTSYKKLVAAIAGVVVLAAFNSSAQTVVQDSVIITGVRFSYPLVQQWIEEYKKENPDARIRIETRTVTDPAKYDLLIEAYEHDKDFKEQRNYVSVGRYALVPIANAQSPIAGEFGEKGLTERLIKQIFFHDIYAEKEKDVKSNYTVYTRLQKAGAPITFARYFGFEQQNIKGKAIGGADEHLLKALQKDNSAITYSTLGLIFDTQSRKVNEGVAVLPVDLDGNGRITKDERVYANLDVAIETLEGAKVKNVPVGDLHLSVQKTSTNTEAQKFLLWVAANGQGSLHKYGFLNPDLRKLESDREKLVQFTGK